MSSMTLVEWVARQGRGAIAKLSKDTGLSYPTVLELSKGRGRAKYETAKKISEATAGEVSIESLCEDHGFPRPPKRVTPEVIAERATGEHAR